MKFARKSRKMNLCPTDINEKNDAFASFFCQGWRGSNSRMTESKSVALPLGYIPKYTFEYKNGVDDRNRTDDLQGHNLAL